MTDQFLHFCGIGDEDEEAEQWEVWQARKRMLSKRVSGKDYRQPQSLPDGSMMPQGTQVSPYEGVRVAVILRYYLNTKIQSIRKSIMLFFKRFATNL